MKNKLNFKFMNLVLIMAILLIPSVLAIGSFSYETSSVSRIFGNSPDDILNQLRRGNSDLEHPTVAVSYCADDTDFPEILSKTFPAVGCSSPSNNQVKAVLDNGLNEFLILGREMTITPSDISGWNGLDEGDFIISNKEYSGLFLSGQDSISSKISSKSNVIAPNSYESMLFVKAFVCNLGKYPTIGETFRQARNNYYWNTAASGFLMPNEYIGLTLISYSLFGKPYSKVTVPNYDWEKIKRICGDYNETYGFSRSQSSTQSTMRASSISIASNDAVVSPYSQEFAFDMPDYQIKDLENYSVLTTEQTDLSFDNNELVLPVKIAVHVFPLKTIINKISVIEISDPVDLTIENLPEWENEYVDRICSSDNKSAEIQFSHTFTEDKELIVAKIHPVEVVNCSSGELRLYRHFEYKIEYIPYSPVLIESIESEQTANSDENMEIHVSLKNILNTDTDGILKIKDQEASVAEKTVLVSGNSVSQEDLEFKIPQYNGVKIFDVEFSQDADIKTKSSFSIKIIGGSDDDDQLINNTPTCNPSAEVCNDGKDNDCDGLTDMQDSDCVINPGDSEICDGIDNDLDGQTDEGFEKKIYSCEFMPGDYRPVDVSICDGTEVWWGNYAFLRISNCIDITPCIPTTEICDGIDNDCDGKIDGITRIVSCSYNACSRNIVQYCSNGVWEGTCPQIESSPENTYEKCKDAIDNDCDGLIDMQDPECLPPVNNTNPSTCTNGKKCASGTMCRGTGTNDCCYGLCRPN